MGCIGAKQPPEPRLDAVRERIAAAGPNEFVPVTRAEFDALKREVERLRGDLGSDQMARAIGAADAAKSRC